MLANLFIKLVDAEHLNVLLFLAKSFYDIPYCIANAFLE